MNEDLYTTAHGDFVIKRPEPHPVVIHDEEGKPMVTVYADHTVKLHQPERVNDAARIFWNAVQWYGVAHCIEGHTGASGRVAGPAGDGGESTG